MNDLYLIGNGFDLAHGLKTSYNDFLLWYLRESISKAEYSPFEDTLLKIDSQNSSFVPSGSPTIPLLLEHSKRSNVNIKFKHDFFKKIVESYRDFKWVDIEYDYYLVLVDFYKRLESSNRSKDFGIDKELERLNICFDFIQNKLVEYLQTIEITSKLENREIESILLEGTGSERKETGEKLFVNFNYTKTMELYTKRNFPTNGNLVSIHGELSDPSNPIIFGYGDEMDPHYGEIENLNNNEFLKNIKSFGYFRTDNYQRVIRFIDSGEFTVKILGHSCGLSDRILLNTIFEHRNCENIKIFHYEKSPSDNDYFEKTQEISRHFKASGKGDMRMKIFPFDKYSKMPQEKSI